MQISKWCHISPIDYSVHYRCHVMQRLLSAIIAPFFTWGPASEAGQGDELHAYVTLGRIIITYHGMAYKRRRSRSQSLHSTRGSHAPPRRLGKPATRGRKTGNVEFQHETRYAEC